MEHAPEQNRTWASNSRATSCPIPTLYIISLIYEKFLTGFQMSYKFIVTHCFGKATLAGQQTRWCAAGFPIGLVSQLPQYLSSCSSAVGQLRRWSNSLPLKFTNRHETANHPVHNSGLVRCWQASLALCCFSHKTLYVAPGEQGNFYTLSRRHVFQDNGYFWLPPTGMVCKMPYRINSSFESSTGICEWKSLHGQKDPRYQILFAMYFILKNLDILLQ